MFCTKALIKPTEKPYVPHVPDWEEWKPPEYVGLFKEGDIVETGEKIGEMGRTGLATGPVLTFMISQDGIFFNPKDKDGKTSDELHCND